MIFLQRLIRRRQSQRRIVWMLVGLLTLALVGLPTQPRRPETAASSGGQPYPCQQHACGCASAEFCWDQCCCYSDAEKLAWAEANDVEPPGFLRRRVAAADSSASAALTLLSSSDEAPRSCCSHGSCDTGTKTVSANADSSRGDESGDRDADTLQSSLVLAWKAAQCRGSRSLWTLLSFALVLDEPPAIAATPIVVQRMVPSDEQAEATADRPDPPIP